MKKLFLIFIFCFFCRQVFAQSALLETALIEPSVKANALGNAFTANNNDVFGIYYNPAQSVKTAQIGSSYQKGYMEDTTLVIAGKMPMKFIDIGGSFYHYGTGTLDMPGNAEGQKDMMFVLNASKKFFNFLSFGANAKYLKSELFSELGASATMFDIGALAEFGKWNFGAGLNNINGALKYNGIDEKIPQVMRAGILYKNFFEDIFLHYSLGVDYVKAGTETFLRAGAEAVYNNLLAGRAGYEKGNNGDGGFAFGVGIMYMEFSLEYAFNYYSGAKQSAHKIGLVYKFLKDGGGEKDGAKNKKSGKAGKKGLRDFTEEDLIEELNKRLKNENAVAASTPDVSVAPAPSAPIKYDDGDDPGAANVPIVQTAPEQPAPSELYAPATGAEPKTDDSETITKSNYFSFIGSKIYLNPQKPAEQYYSLGGDSIGDEYAGQILTIENISLSPRGDSLLLYLSDKKENILVKTARLGNGGHAEFSNIFLIRKDKINAGKND